MTGGRTGKGRDTVRGGQPTEKYCTECGAAIDGRAVICPECGVQVGAIETSDGSTLDTVATVASWAGVVLMLLLAVGTVTESVSGMPVRMAVATLVYLCLAAFAAPPVRRYLDTEYDVAFGRGTVVVILLGVGLANEAVIAPPLA